MRRLLKSLSISPLFLFLTIILRTILPIYAPQGLSITVTTDKQAYCPGEAVLIYGNLTFNATLVTDGLVGLQVQNPENKLLIIRTLTAGTNPPITPYVRVSRVISCDSSGDPKESFRRGTLAYFKLTVRNYDIEPREALMTVNTYDPNDIPFGSASIKTTLSAQTTSIFIISIPIPADATTGNATAYANAYTEWPQLEGTPYCTEVSTTFQITNGASSQSTTVTPKNQAETTPQVNGNYNTTLQLPPQATTGNYTIYATSDYQSEKVFNKTTLKVNPLGDFDGDGDVDSDDVLTFLCAWIDYWFNPPLDPEYEVCDFDEDGAIDPDDVLAFLSAWIDYWS